MWRKTDDLLVAKPVLHGVIQTDYTVHALRHPDAWGDHDAERKLLFDSASNICTDRPA